MTQAYSILIGTVGQGLGVSEDVAEGETVEVTLSFLLAQQHHVRCNADEVKGGEAVITVKALGL